MAFGKLIERYQPPQMLRDMQKYQKIKIQK